MLSCWAVVERDFSLNSVPDEVIHVNVLGLALSMGFLIARAQ
jgi:hypothetical protein